MLNYTIPREFDPQIQDKHVTLPQDLPDYQALMMMRKQFMLPRQTVTA